MSATKILSPHLQRIADRTQAKREFLRAYPALNECLMDLKRAGFEVDPTRLEYAIHGPLNDRRVWVQAVEGHAKGVDAPKKGRKR